MNAFQKTCKENATLAQVNNYSSQSGYLISLQKFASMEKLKVFSELELFWVIGSFTSYQLESAI